MNEMLKKNPEKESRRMQVGMEAEAVAPIEAKPLSRQQAKEHVDVPPFSVLAQEHKPGSIQIHENVPREIVEEATVSVAESEEPQSSRSMLSRLRRSKLGKALLGAMFFFAADRANSRALEASGSQAHEMQERVAQRGLASEAPVLEIDLRTNTKEQDARQEVYTQTSESFNAVMEQVGLKRFLLEDCVATGGVVDFEQAVDFYSSQFRSVIGWNEAAYDDVGRAIGLSGEEVKMKARVIQETLVNKPTGMNVPGAITRVEYAGAQYFGNKVEPEQLADIYRKLYQLEASVIKEGLRYSAFTELDTESKEVLHKALSDVGGGIVATEIIKMRIIQLAGDDRPNNLNRDVIFEGLQIDTAMSDGLLTTWQAKMNQLEIDMRVLIAHIEDPLVQSQFTQWFLNFKKDQAQVLQDIFTIKANGYFENDAWKGGVEQIRLFVE